MRKEYQLEKKNCTKSTLKAMFYLVDFLRTSSPRDRTLRSFWRAALKRKGGGRVSRIHWHFFKEDQVVRMKPFTTDWDSNPCAGTRTQPKNIKTWLLSKKTRHPKLRNLALFYVWEDANVWAHWNHSFDWFQLSGASILLWHPEFLRAHCKEWVQSDGC